MKNVKEGRREGREGNVSEVNWSHPDSWGSLGPHFTWTRILGTVRSLCFYPTCKLTSYVALISWILTEIRRLLGQRPQVLCHRKIVVRASVCAPVPQAPVPTGDTRTEFLHKPWGGKRTKSTTLNRPLGHTDYFKLLIFKQQQIQMKLWKLNRS